MKQVPFRQKPEDGNTCSLFTLANVFNNVDFLKLDSHQIKKYGISLSEENIILHRAVTNVTDGWLTIEDCCKDLRGLETEQAVYYLTDDVEDGRYNLFLISSKAKGGFHRSFLFTNGEYFWIVDSLDKEIPRLDSIVGFSYGKRIISISTFFEDRKPKSFTREELQHLLD